MTRRKKLETNEAIHVEWSNGPDVEWDDPTFDAVVGSPEEPPEIDLSVLTEKQRFVIESLFGFGRPEISERELAGYMGISQQAVHKLKEKALMNLRRGLSDWPL